MNLNLQKQFQKIKIEIQDLTFRLQILRAIRYICTNQN